MDVLNIKTHRRAEFLDITREVAEAVSRPGVADGVVTVFGAIRWG